MRALPYNDALIHEWERSVVRTIIEREGELRVVDDHYELTILRPDGAEEVEQFDTEEQLTTRWSVLQHQFLREGWWGPHGRE